MNAPTPRPHPRRTVRNWTRPESYLDRGGLFFPRPVDEPRRTSRGPRFRSPLVIEAPAARTPAARTWLGWHLATPLLAILLAALLWLTIA